MATRAANKRLIREYKNIQENPPPFIEAHPSEANILEWHYIITGPPNTPYHGGQYWGTLVFPPDYPFKPPAIRMMTPSGRFQTNTRLCLSISDFHPKSFNPAWEVSTILIGLLSFMTSEEMTTGSISSSEQERKILAARSRWWNSTGGGTTERTYEEMLGGGRSGGRSAQGSGERNGRTTSNVIKPGDGGERFRKEFPEVDLENWKWMKERRINLQTGIPAPLPSTTSSSSMSSATAQQQRVGLQAENILRNRHPGQAAAASLNARSGGVAATESWIKQHKFLCAVVLLCGYVLVARMFE